VAFEAGWDQQGDPDSGGPSEVWMRSLNPGGPNFAPLAAAPSNQPDWSPDGNRIAFNADDCCSFPSGRLHTIRPDGGDRHAIPTAPEGADEPSWSPDGANLAYRHQRVSQNAEIYRVRSDGTGATILTHSGGESPAWSPDGTKIAYVLPNGHVAVMDANGGNQTDLGVTGADPSWQPIVGYARPKGATPTEVKLVPAARACTSSNSSHGAPLAVPSCNPPAQASEYITVGTPDANGKPANSAGFVRTRVFSCPMCEAPINAEVFITAELTDVRNKSDLTDYTGELQGRIELRMTDGYNGPSLSWPGTVVDTPLTFPISCTATSEGTVGSTCAVSTSANAISPGLVEDGRRAVWQLGQVQIYDGGPDGDADTAGDNTLFAVQGLYAP
jgi:hypothetical protein